MAKDKDYKRLIHTEKWLLLRRDKLTAYPLCERCQAQGKIRAATEVHHIKPVEDGLTYREKVLLMFDSHNLQALCHECHIKTHTEMGRSGKAQAKRQAKEHLKRFEDKFLK